MVRDDLLEQIRQPLLERIDRRLAVVLAISIAAHVAIAIVAWSTDPPVRTWLEIGPVATYSEDTLPILAAPPGEPAPARPAIAAPAPAPRAPGRPVRPRAVAPIDPDAAMAGMFDRDPMLGPAARRAPGGDLDKQLEAARARDQAARVGHDRVDGPERIGDGTDPMLDGPDGIAATEKGGEDAGGRVELGDDGFTVDPGVDFDPYHHIKARYMPQIMRCYRGELRYQPTLRGRIDLELTIGADGAVVSARATGLDELEECVEQRARAWTFPVKLPKPMRFGLPLLFVPADLP